MVGVSHPSLCALLQSVSLVSSLLPLYSFLQAGRFTTKRQRESPINLVANHALDSSVDLCLCPSVCICSFLFPLTHFHLCLIYPLCQPFLFFNLYVLVDLLFHLPYRPPHLAYITHFLSLPLTPSIIIFFWPPEDIHHMHTLMMVFKAHMNKVNWM